jgi:hypothetical protein
MALNLEELQALETQFDFDAQQIAENLGNEDIKGTEEEDFLIGSVNSEAIAGLAGNDTLLGKSDLDTLLGGKGDDQIECNGGNALLIGNEGNDNLSVFVSTDAADRNSTLLGGQGEDSINSGSKDDLLFGGSEADELFSFAGKDTLSGGEGDDIFDGGDDNDELVGDNGNDTITGEDGNDLIDGGNGNDRFYDTQGSDRLTGGEGKDQFVLLSGNNTDTIADFQNGQDKFLLVEDLPQRGLTFEQLEITESKGNTNISVADTGEVLVELTGVSAEAINAEDFTTKTTQELFDSQPGMEMSSSESESSTQGQNSFQTLAQSNQPDNQNTQPSENQPGQSGQLAPEAEIGSVTSQGVEAMNVDEARKNFNVDGKGIKIGVISDSFDTSLSASTRAEDDVLSGDLPGKGNPNGYNTPVSVLDDYEDNSLFNPSPLSASSTDEGRAMLQLIHDVAPGAELIFQERGNSDKEFAGAINDLTAAGADIIVDDIAFLRDEPFFQDGSSSQAIDDAAAQGVAYFSSVGNDADNSYESKFRAVESGEKSTIPGLEGYVFHDFNPEAEVDIFQGVTLEPGESIGLTFQWDEPSASAGGKGASNDLDLFLLDSENKIVAASNQSNVDGDAEEYLSFFNETEKTGEYNLVVGQDVAAGGEAPGLIKYISSGLSSDNTEYFTGSSTVYGHKNAAGTEAVGAAAYQDTPAFGADEPIISPGSSIGNTPILFDAQGNRLPEAEIRQNPEIVAPDDTNNTFFGFDTEGDGFPNFSGTSAAAPHAAGVAALLMEANPNATPEQVYQALEISALDMDNPYTPGADPGYDSASGYGFIQADRALDEILGTSNTDLASSSQDTFV